MDCDVCKYSLVNNSSRFLLFNCLVLSTRAPVGCGGGGAKQTAPHNTKIHRCDWTRNPAPPGPIARSRDLFRRLRPTHSSWGLLANESRSILARIRVALLQIALFGWGEGAHGHKYVLCMVPGPGPGPALADLQIVDSYVVHRNPMVYAVV